MSTVTFELKNNLTTSQDDLNGSAESAALTATATTISITSGNTGTLGTFTKGSGNKAKVKFKTKKSGTDVNFPTNCYYCIFLYNGTTCSEYSTTGTSISGSSYNITFSIPDTDDENLPDANGDVTVPASDDKVVVNVSAGTDQTCNCPGGGCD